MNNRFKNIFIAVAALCIFVSVNTNAQDLEAGSKTGEKWYFGITGGLSSPFGNYTKTDYADNKSGFASGGGNIGITGTYFITKHFGINALVSYQGFGFHGAQNLADGFKDDFAIDSSTVNIEGSNYNLNFLIGPYYSVPLGKHFSVDFRVLVGLTSAHLAGNQVFVEDQGDATFMQKKASATAFGMQAGAGLRYNFSSHFGLMLNLDYFNSKPNFSIENSNRANEAGRKLTTYNQPIQGLNTNLTLVYSLRK